MLRDDETVRPHIKEDEQKVISKGKSGRRLFDDYKQILVLAFA